MGTPVDPLLQIPLAAGRGLEARDMNGGRVAVINESLAREVFGGGPAIGRSFRWEGKGGWEAYSTPRLPYIL